MHVLVHALSAQPEIPSVHSPDLDSRAMAQLAAVEGLPRDHPGHTPPAIAEHPKSATCPRPCCSGSGTGSRFLGPPPSSGDSPLAESSGCFRWRPDTRMDVPLLRPHLLPAGSGSFHGRWVHLAGKTCLVHHVLHVERRSYSMGGTARIG
jgi:hypothetical protein